MSDPLEETTINAESLAQLSPFELQVAEFTAESRVVRFRGRERGSHPFRLDLEITATRQTRRASLPCSALRRSWRSSVAAATLFQFKDPGP